MSSRPRVWTRFAAGLAIVACGWLTLLPLGVAGTRWGLLWGLAALGALGRAGGRVASDGLPEPRRLILGVTLAGLVAGALLWMATPPTWSRLNHEYERLAIPEAAVLVRQAQGGNTICFDYCPAIHRVFHVEADVEEALDAFAASFADAGFSEVRVSHHEGGDRGGLYAVRRRSLVAATGRVSSRGGVTVVELELERWHR